MHVIRRAGPHHVGLETTLLVHGVPRERSASLAEQLDGAVRDAGAMSALIGVVDGTPVVGMTGDELARLLDAPDVPKVNTANLGVALHRNTHGATTVSTTVELAARAGLRVVATGGIGGVHREYGTALDISADLGAIARHPVAVVTSGVKSLLDVRATREVLETLGIPVVGFRTDSFPAFYVRETDIGVDARFDDATDLASYVGIELARTGRGIVIANACPAESAMSEIDWETLLQDAQNAVGAVTGRDVTPALLAQIHALSSGASLEANVALAVSNAALAGAVCAAATGSRT